MAKELSAKRHPASGALRIKHDASDDETLYEIKDANRVHTIKVDEIESLWREAVMAEKEPVYVIQFTGGLALYCYPMKGKRNGSAKDNDDYSKEI